MTLAINAGFYNLKIMTEAGEKITIPARVQINVDAKQSIECDGKIYEIGAGARSLVEKTDSLTHQLLTEYAILKYAGAKAVNLVVALPLTMYLNKPYREAYKEGLLGKHEGVIDGENRTVTVKDCTVYAEGASAYLNNKTLLSDKVVGILDFGGHTVNGLIYQDGNLIKDSMCQLDLGMIKLERRLIDAINQEKLWNIKDYELMSIIKSGECNEIIHQVFTDYMSEIKERLLQKQWGLERLEIFATGGGVCFIKPYLKQAFERLTLSNNPLYDNVLGLYEVGKVIYNA